MSYSYRIEAIYRSDMPQTAFSAPIQPRGIAGHWTVGGIGRAGALSTISFLAGTPTRNASYHEVWYWERVSRIFGVIRIVPARNAAHSMNPVQPPNGPWNPVAEVKRILGDRWWDPNRYSYAAAYAGGPSDLALDLREPDFVDGCARRSRELLGELSGSLADRPLFTHAQGQPGNKTDWGSALTPLIYGELLTLPDTGVDPMPTRDFVPQLWRAQPSGAELREQASLDAEVLATVPAGTAMFSVGETLDYRWREVVAQRPGEPERLYFVRRSQLDEMQPSGRDPELLAGIQAVINARLAGKPAPSADCGPEVTKARLEIAKDLEMFADTLKQ